MVVRCLLLLVNQAKHRARGLRNVSERSQRCHACVWHECELLPRLVAARARSGPGETLGSGFPQEKEEEAWKFPDCFALQEQVVMLLRLTRYQ